MILCAGTMSDRQYFLSLSKEPFWLFIWKKKRNWKTWEFESGCSSDEDKEKKYRFVWFCWILHRSEFLVKQMQEILQQGLFHEVWYSNTLILFTMYM